MTTRRVLLRRGPRWIRGTLLAAAALVLAAPLAGQPATSGVWSDRLRLAADGTGEPTPITLVQANINKDMSTKKFDADIATVFAEDPDLITFNEVYARDSAKLAPEGYAIFRTPGPRTGWAPVVWKTSVWTALDQGTYQISWRPKGQPGMVGVRYANWVTLVDAQGQVVSLISSHIAPNDKDTDQLLVPSLIRLRDLATQLSAQGPVILAGDFNMGYHSDRYHPQYLAEAGLTDTYDLTGTSFPTHRLGGTIDYVFLGPDGSFTVDDQYPVLLNSDHRAVVAHLELQPSTTTPPPDDLPTFQPGRVVFNPRGTAAQRRAIRAVELKAIQAAPAGAAIHIASPLLDSTSLTRAVIKAHERGVNVTVITSRRKLTALEDKVRELVGGDIHASQFLKRVAGVWPARTNARGAAKRGKLPATVLLISQAGATPAFGLVADMDLSKAAAITRRGTKHTAWVTTDADTYDRLYRAYLAVIGRTY